MLRVLVVEDEEMIRKGIVLAADWAERSGAWWSERPLTERRGLRRRSACKPSLIITDLKMPENGRTGDDCASSVSGGAEAYVDHPDGV